MVSQNSRWPQQEVIILSYSSFSSSHVLFHYVLSRPMVPQLAPPKIPEGDRVDFDVSVKALYFGPINIVKKSGSLVMGRR